MGSEAAGQSPKPPVQQRSLASHQQMVDVALRLLEMRDIDQISVRDIVCEAGTSNGSFYHRFGTKEHFFNYLIDDMLERRERGAIAQLSDQTIPFDGLPELLARSAMVAVNDSLPVTNPLKRHTRIQEAAFWTVIVSGGYGLYVIMTL